ncbi:MAG: DnaD domain protein [Clostridia bacterium]|nr:DnaD domain protein [Clostridia bacterium]
MSFAKFSSDFLMETFTLVDNLFINEYLPSCDEKQIKIYLYGLYLCANPANDNSLEALCSRLDMKENEIIKTYTDFEDMGLVQIISREPLEVKYLSLKRSMQPPKKYKGEKWNDFNTHLQQLFPERMLTPNEYNEYYTFLDDSKMEHDAMLMIVQYCIDLKGMGVRYPYILTVARNWANDGVRTAQDVENKLKEYDTQSEQMRTVLAAIGRKGGAELEEKQMLLKWTRSWGYELDAILAAAKTLKGGKSFTKLDSKLDEFYRMSIFSAEEMKGYQVHREHLKDLAISINKNLGVFYESFEHEIEVYISPWTAKGFEDKALTKIAHHCFITNIRTLDGMNNVVNKFYAQGRLSADSIDEYLRLQIEQDAKIKKIIEKSGRSRNVTQSDRDYYHTWTVTWGFDDEVILYAAEQATFKTYPTPYINQLLSTYKANGVTTVEQAKKLPIASGNDKPRKADFEERSYTAEELHSIVTSIDSLNDSDL